MGMTKLFGYQKKGIRLIRRFNGRVLLADEMGLGKSIQAITYAMEENAFPVIVICPASLKYNWQKEWRKHAGIRADIFSSTKPHAWSSFNRHKVSIINYDILPYWYPYIRKMKRRLGVKTIIVDECKDIKSASSIKNKYVRKICRGVDNIIMLDGTPLTNGRPAELFPAISILRPDVFDSFWTYGMKFCEGAHRNGKWEFKGATNLPELHQLLIESCMIRRRKDQVLKDLPPKARYVVPLEISNRKEYRKASTDFYGWLAQFGKKKLRAAIRAAAFVQAGYLLRLAAELKLPAIIEWIDNFLEQSDGKLIVFGLHKKILHPLRERYKSLSIYVDGSVVAEKRQYAMGSCLAYTRRRQSTRNRSRS
jgi:SWI/SNF-related matrix-associated actin-dependent regulator 1 of chromatin subfamily A